MQMQNAKTALCASGVATEEALAPPNNQPRRVEQPTHRSEPKRVHATVLFGDIVGSTERLAEVGDRQWMEVLNEYYAIIRKELGTFQGQHISTAGDGFLATFEQYQPFVFIPVPPARGSTSWTLQHREDRSGLYGPCARDGRSGR